MNTLTVRDMARKLAEFAVEYAKDGAYGFASLEAYQAHRLQGVFPDGLLILAV